MTNPDNSVGTNAAFGGRTSVNAFNDDLGAYSRGVLSGWGCVPNSGLTVALGGSGDERDVAVAVDPSGNKTTINNISNSPISVTISAAPASNTRIDAIVAYVDSSPQGSADITDNYEACGLITVTGTASSSPVAPNESTIRSAITADGASGSTAYYVVLAYISLASGTTDITSANILDGDKAKLPINRVDTTSLPDDDYSTSEILTNNTWVDGSPIYKKTVSIGTLPNNSSKTVAHGVANLKRVIKIGGYAYYPTNSLTYPVPFASVDTEKSNIVVTANATNIVVGTGIDRTNITECYITMYYTKN